MPDCDSRAGSRVPGQLHRTRSLWGSVRALFLPNPDLEIQQQQHPSSTHLRGKSQQADVRAGSMWRVSVHDVGVDH